MTPVAFGAPYELAAMKMRVQVGFGLLGYTVTALNLADLNPLASGIAGSGSR
jgi:hypothetical protein